MPLSESDSEFDVSDDSLFVEAFSHGNVLVIPTDDPVVHSRGLRKLTQISNGRKVLVGSVNGDVDIYDWSSIGPDLLPVGTIRIDGGQSVSGLAVNSSDSLVLVWGQSEFLWCWSIDERQKKFTTIRGDMYISNAAGTKGHTHKVTSAEWHPSDGNVFASSSVDGTVRIWNVSERGIGIDERLPHMVVYKMPDARGRTTGLGVKILSLAWAPEGAQFIACGTNIGSVGIWPIRQRGYDNKPILHLEGCHKGAVTQVKVFQRDLKLLTRGDEDDQTVKIWHLEAFIPNLRERLSEKSVIPKTIKQPIPLLTIPASSVNGGVEDQCVLVSIDGKYAAVVTNDEGIKLVNLNDGSVVRRLQSCHLSELNAPTKSREPVALTFCTNTRQMIILTRSGDLAAVYDLKKSRKGVLNLLANGKLQMAKSELKDEPVIGTDTKRVRVASKRGSGRESYAVFGGIIVNADDPDNFPAEFAIGTGGDVLPRKRRAAAELSASNPKRPVRDSISDD